MDKKQKLEKVSQQVAKCQKCPLYENATNPVPGEGNPEAEIMFIGESPGYNEDQQGRPFVGQAGKLLDQLLQLIKVRRTDVFIANVVKHRPPENRDPLPEEIEACKNYLDEQIKIINPKIIVTLGRFSMNKFLPGEYISRAHGQARFVDFAGERHIVIPMYHPAAALRSTRVMEEIKEDFKKIIKFLKGNTEEIVEDKNPESEEKQLSLIN